MMPNGDQGLLSLPPELLHEIVQNCPKQTCHRLRETCKILQEHADPIVFHRLLLHRRRSDITENQITALATRSSRACEFTRVLVLEFDILRNSLGGEQSPRPHFVDRDDLRAHLPTALSVLRNLTRFEWYITGSEPTWLIDSITSSVACLPKLTELAARAPTMTSSGAAVLIPLGLFSNLSKLSVQYGSYKIAPFFISQMSTVIANSPQLRYLEVAYSSDGEPQPTLSDLLSKLSANNPLFIEELVLSSVDATLEQVTLPHLTKLTSFSFDSRHEDISIVQSVWASFLVNNIRLSDVTIGLRISLKTMLYLLSFSGLKKLVVRDIYPPLDMTTEDFENMLFAEVLPKHAISLQVLGIHSRRWPFDTASGPILKCLKLRKLQVYVNINNMPIQQLLDTVAHLPELMVLVVTTTSYSGVSRELANFKPIQGLRYVENLEIVEPISKGKAYMLEKDGERAVRYRGIERMVW